MVCTTVVATTLAAVMSPAAAGTAMAPPGPTSNVPAILSGTISYGFADTVVGGCAGCRTSESMSVDMAVAGDAVSGATENPGLYADNPDVYRCALAARTGSKCFWVPLQIKTASVHYHFATHLAVPHGCHTYASATGAYRAVSAPLPLGLDVVFNPGRASVTGGAPLAPSPPYGLSSLPPTQSYRATGNVNLQMAMSYTNRAAASACGITLPTSVWDLLIEFVGQYHPGETTLRGNTEYQGLGSPRLSWDLALKATGLEITSPMAGSTIALTDSNYFSPQPGPNNVAPSSRTLTVYGTDNSPGASTVRIGNISTPITSDGNWTARVRVTAPGSRTLTAEDNVGAKTDDQITVIDLVVSSPAEGAVLPVTAAPAMPALGAVATVEGYPGGISGVTFHWALTTRGEYRDRCGHDPIATCGQWYPYNDIVGSGTTTGRTPWGGHFSTIEGGFGRLSVSAYVPRVLDEPVESEPRWIDITGTNPGIPSIKAYVATRDPANAPVEDEIFCHESGFTQFRPSPEPREPTTTTVPHNIPGNPGPFWPLYGAPFAGIGIAQKDPAIFPIQQWNWHANVQAGIAVYNEALAGAKEWRQAEQVRLSAELTAVLRIVNHQRALRGMKGVRMAPRKVPPLTSAQVEREAIRRYNGGDEYRFDLHYVVSANHLSVKIVGKGKWAEGAGYWQDMASWQAAGGPLVARAWIAGQNPAYVALVRACNA